MKKWQKRIVIIFWVTVLIVIIASLTTCMATCGMTVVDGIGDIDTRGW